MKAEIITIGDEILIGQVTDTNSAWIARALNGIGVEIECITAIPDQPEAIKNALDAAANRTDLVMITGGLGPTKDDITKKTLAGYFGSKLVRNEAAVKKIKEFLTLRGVELSNLNLDQAMLPDNCIPVPNRYGTASGMWFKKNGKDFIAMPGVPYEMKSMLTDHILPELQKQFDLPVIIHRTIITQGIPESHLARLLSDFEQQLPEEIRLAYLPSPGLVRLRLSIIGREIRKTEQMIQKALYELMTLIPEYISGLEDESIEKVIAALLVEKGTTLATAESCTGGNIAHLITSVPGSSRYFVGAVVAYSNDIKERILGVKKETIEKHGAVSEPVVKEMASGIRNLYQSDYAIATSGIAGPDGGSVEKPVGTTWIAVASACQIKAEKYLFGDLRATNIQKASVTALNMLRKLIQSEK
ncbi:MAG: damage-inducible protein CinA [Bacteroides sp. SM23_62_1]|nr:MAG: damage-inducible protein CinA [Bacteroides sp. SM23_62_1]